MEIEIYSVRICLELERTRTLTGLESSVTVCEPKQLEQWTLKQVSKASGSRGQRIDLRSPAFISESEAEEIGQRAIGALMIVALQRNFGFLISDSQLNGMLFESGRRLLEGNKFDMVLDDVLGITVYPACSRVGFAYLPPLGLEVSTPAIDFIQEWAKNFYGVTFLSSKVWTSFDLWASARSTESVRVRFLLFIMAIEALVEPTMRSEDELKAVDFLLRDLQSMLIDENAKTRLSNGISILKRESIRTSCKRYIIERIGREACKTFERCYGVRSRITHGENAPNIKVLVQDVRELEVIVKQLLMGELKASWNEEPIA